MSGRILVALLGGLSLVGAALCSEAQTSFRDLLAGRSTQFFLQAQPSQASDLIALANQKHAQGNYAEAELLLTHALEIDVKTLGPDSPEVATVLNNLGEAYRQQGKFADGEQLYLRSISIDAKAYGPDNTQSISTLDNLGLLYKDEARYEEAEALHWRALSISSKAYGKDSMPVAITLNCLSALYLKQGKYMEAEPLLRRSLEIRQKLLAPDHPDIGTAMNNLASVYLEQGKYAEAEPLLEKALAIDEKGKGKEHPVVAMDLGNLGHLNEDQGKYAEAERYYVRALSIEEKSLGPDHHQTTVFLQDLAALYYSQKDYVKAEPVFKRIFENLQRQFQYNFSYMSEKDRLSFLASVSGEFPTYFSFCLTYYAQDPALAGAMYDVVLWQKGLVAGSIASLRTRIAHSGDKDTLDLLDHLTARRAEIARLLSLSPQDTADAAAKIARLQEETDVMERELAKRSIVVNERNRMATVSWRDIQKSLAPGEAAIEFVRFGLNDGRQRTGAAKYVALILTPGTKIAPALVSIGDADQLESAALQDYWHRVEIRAPDPASGVQFYLAMWKPLETKLAGIKRLYLSPDGLLNQISLAAVPTDDGRLLIEKYDIRVVLSSKDLLRQKSPIANRSAVLIGDPEFDLSESQQKSVIAQLKQGAKPQTVPAGESVASNAMPTVGRGLRSQDQPRQQLNRLPGTAQEVKSIAALLSVAGWHVDTFTGPEALEETVKGVKSARVLHIATHGFFEPDQVRATQASGSGSLEDAMLRSGLYFAGADRVLSGARPAADLDDGVLTAYEATGLNLQGTELVVLSACETGLGESTNGEGVFGLRRALQEAGAQAVMMSMWKVPDSETRQLMTLFYQKWLSGKDKQTALREAQLELRQDVMKRWQEDRPHDWAAFVLVSP